MNALNKINTGVTETAYIVLDRETSDFQEVDSTIGRALEADLETITLVDPKDPYTLLKDATADVKEELATVLDYRKSIKVILAGWSF